MPRKTFFGSYINYLKGGAFVVLLACFVPSVVFGRVTLKGNRYYGYGGLGTGFGGFYANPKIDYVDVGGGKSAQFVLANGIAAGGFAGLLQGQIGFEWRFVNHLYVAVELNGNVAFNQTVQSGYVGGIGAAGGGTGEIEVRSARSTGSNAFAGLYVATKIGWTDASDSVSFYGILGFGYEFSPGVLISSVAVPASGAVKASTSTNVYDMEFGGFRLQYGIGGSYYFNDNFGLYLHFVLTSPIPQGTLTSTSAVNDALKPHLDGSFMSFSYLMNLGLTVRF